MRHIYDFKKTLSYGTPIRRRTKPNYGGREKIMVVVFIFVVIGWIYTFYFSSFFKIRNVMITGLEVIPNGSIEQLLNAQDKNIFRLNIKKAIAAVQAAYFIENVTIKKLYPQSLTIAITEKHPSFEFDTSAHNYLLDANGFVLHEESASGTLRINPSLPLLETADNASFAVRDRGIEQKKIEAITFFITNLKTENNIDIAKTVFSAAEPEVVTFKTTEGFDIITSYREDVKTQLFKLTAFFKDQGEKRKNLLYINARFVDRVYFKFKN